jgi:hypothetical protein
LALSNAVPSLPKGAVQTKAVVLTAGILEKLILMSDGTLYIILFAAYYCTQEL